jgi:hypothetical protein
MANPNKTVARAMRQAPARERTADTSTEFSRWLVEQAQKGRTFDSMDAARAEFDKERGE